MHWLSKAELELAQLLDGRGNFVARLEPNPLFLRIAYDHALRSAREYDVSGLQRHQLRSVAHELGAVEDHVIRVR